MMFITLDSLQSLYNINKNIIRVFHAGNTNLTIEERAKNTLEYYLSIVSRNGVYNLSLIDTCILVYSNKLLNRINDTRFNYLNLNSYSVANKIINLNEQEIKTEINTALKYRMDNFCLGVISESINELQDQLLNHKQFIINIDMFMNYYDYIKGEIANAPR